MTIRERIEELERATLSPHAALSAESRGREVDEPQCDVRTVYQRDRDRIIHQSKAFRRLAGNPTPRAGLFTGEPPGERK